MTDATADLWRLRRRGEASVDPAFGLAEMFGARPGIAEIAVTILVCALSACFIEAAAWYILFIIAAFSGSPL
jgi:hypothetical protein